MSASARALERLASTAPLEREAPRRRMLVISNPYASTVSDRLKNLVVYALQGRYAVETVDTEARDHCTEICREAAAERYDAVVAFGGDGTVNEAANGLAGSETPLAVLPGGRTNVFCRMLGMPHEIVDATEHLLRLADDWRVRRVDLARVNGRHYTFSSGLGLDASVVERVDIHPRRKVRFGEWYFTYVAIATFARRYVLAPPRLEVTAGGRTVAGVTAIVQNGAPFTYFANRPIEVAEGATLDGGTLAGVVLERASPLDMPTLAWRAFNRRARVAKHRRVTPFGPVTEVRAVSADGRPVPLQVDGDHIGDVTEAEYGITPRALAVIA